MTSSDLLERIRHVFAAHPRPEHFTNYRHCCECAEHDATLAGQTPATISLEELGNPGWDPACFMTDAAFFYYFPGLARLAVGRGEQSYLWQFAFHLTAERLGRFSAAERVVVTEFLWHLVELLGDDPATAEVDLHELDRCLRVLDSLSMPTTSTMPTS